MEKKWECYLETLTKEVGEELAKNFVKNLYDQSSGSVKIASSFFYKLGKTWAPSMYLWAEWIKKKARGELIALILRDAKPLGVLPVTRSWKRLYLNRQICGIPDELSGDIKKKGHRLLRPYLSENNCNKYFTFVDSGCYGTIVLELHRLGIEFQPLFFFSKNPHIPGFLNDLGVSEKEGEILNDSLECAFPNIFERPSIISEVNNKMVVKLKQSDILSVLFGKSALKGVRAFNPKECGLHEIEIKKLIHLSQLAHKGIFTGLLGDASPEWSQKKVFLDNWPKELDWH